MEKYDIRPLLESDREGVIDFFNSMGEESAVFFNIQRGNEKRTLLFLDGGNRDHLFWTVELDGRLAGIVFIWDKNMLVPMLGIAVHDEYQGKHIGSAMLGFVINYAKSTGCGGLMLTTAKTNFKAQRLYEKYGLVRMGVHTDGEYFYLLCFKRV